MTRANERYHEENSGTGLWVTFDMRIPGADERFNHERAAWAECAEVEMLDADHPVLIITPGAAWGLGK